MRYNKFLFKETLFLIILYVFGIAATFIMHALWFKDEPISDMLISTTQTAAWLITSYIFFIDMNNKLISRLIINGGTRSKIWVSKAITVVLTAVVMTAIQTAVIIIDRGGLSGCSDQIIKVSVMTLLMTTFIGALTALLSVLIKNMGVVVILIFAYICPWTYIMAANYCERSKHLFIKSNPFYYLLKMSNTGTLTKMGIILCCITGLALWFVSFIIIQRKEQKEDNG